MHFVFLFMHLLFLYVHFNQVFNSTRQVGGLQEGGQYQLEVRAVNERGRSTAAHLTLTSAPNGSAYHLHGQ